MPPRGRATQCLSCILEALVGHTVFVELKNDIVIKGKLAEADPHMNMRVTDAQIKRLDGSARSVEEVFVQGVNVRYVHLPPKVDVSRRVEEHRASIAAQHRQMRTMQNMRSQQEAEARRARERDPP